MIIAHLADLHLGFRAWHRLTPSGENLREADVAAAFANAVEAVVRISPDLVLVTGDIFHSVRPPNGAIAEAFRRFSSLASRLPGRPIVLLAGDRDTPRSADTAPILDLFREISGVVVATSAAARVHVDSHDCSVLALPHQALTGEGAARLEPDPGVSLNVLALHGQLAGSGASAAGGAMIPEDTIVFDDWDYVALGHLPARVRIADNAWYAGSLERTTPQPWLEAGGEKGFISYDTQARTATMHVVEGRPVIDLPRIQVSGLSAADLNRAIRESCEAIPGGVEGKIVRLVLTEMPRERMRELDHARLRRYRADAVHFVLDPRPPSREVPLAAAVRVRGRSLESLVEEYFGHGYTPSLDGIERERLLELARGYLARIGEGES